MLACLYAGTLPMEEDWGPTSLELAQMADRFQMQGLYQHFVRNFREGLCPGNVVEWLVQVHDSGLAALEDEAMDYVRANALTFQVQFACLCSLHQHTYDLPFCRCLSTRLCLGLIVCTSWCEQREALPTLGVLTKHSDLMCLRKEVMSVMISALNKSQPTAEEVGQKSLQELTCQRYYLHDSAPLL
jgi:hypothetical protein